MPEDRVDDDALIAEDPHLPFRTIVAPRTGIFIPVLKPEIEGERVTLSCGLAVGTMDCQGEQIEVTSPFSGTLMGFLVASGERVRPNQPVAWVQHPP